MDLVQLPHEILLYISTFGNCDSLCGVWNGSCRLSRHKSDGGPCHGGSGKALLQQLLLHRPFYEYYTANRRYCIQMHTVVTTNNKRTVYTVFGKPHSVDGPAIIDSNGEQRWYLNGKLHRVDGPAVIYASGSQEWWQNGKLHRLDGPAAIDTYGTQWWYQNGKRHWDDGPAVIGVNGAQHWYQNGKLLSKHDDSIC